VWRSVASMLGLQRDTPAHTNGHTHTRTCIAHTQTHTPVSRFHHLHAKYLSPTHTLPHTPSLAHTLPHTHTHTYILIHAPLIAALFPIQNNGSVYRLEDGTETEQGLDRKALMGNMLLENPEAETRWYFRYFLGHAHSNFVTKITKSGSSDLLVLSVLEEAVRRSCAFA